MTSDGPRIRRVDERLGLSVLRASLSPVTLVTYARDHVAVRTPSRPDVHVGNTLDLTGVPEPDQLVGLLDRYEQTIGTLGAGHVQLRWETPLDPDAPPTVATPDTEVLGRARALGLAVSSVTVLLLDQLLPPAGGAAVELAPVPAPGDQAGGAVDRRWHATTVLYRYLAGDTPDDWRGNDDTVVAWSVEQQRELARIGRCQVWVALRYGMPVGRLSLLHDRQGLAVVEDVVVHPAHRRRGIASALTHRAIAHHLEVDPSARLGLAAAPGSGAELLSRRLGFRPHATVWSAFAPAGAR